MYFTQTPKTQYFLKWIWVLVLLILISACVVNQPYRSHFVDQPCYLVQPDCDQSFIEQHLAFDLTFLEFTERGNLYNRNHASDVMNFIDTYAKSDNGAAVFVFVHGWKHTANASDSNVTQFKDFLAKAAENEIVGRRKVIGVYVGWRGKSTNIPLVKETTYWARKSVAEEIGSGGATEVLSELQQILVSQFEQHDAQQRLPKNSYVIIGHSFGGAIVLSAMHDVLLHELIQSAGAMRSSNTNTCAKVKRFADGIVLLNPAIEANKIILLKEAAARCQFNNDQPTLMHIVSTDADLATKRYFPIGQSVNVTQTLSPKKLPRVVNNKNIELNEGALNLRTAGNLQQLRTAYLGYDKNQQQWRFSQCRDDLAQCGISSQKQQQNHFPNHVNDPLKFIKTDASFMKNHNDVFGCYTQSFITTSILETQAIDKGYASSNSLKNGGCDPLSFNFKQCFNQQLDEYECAIPNS